MSQKIQSKEQFDFLTTEELREKRNTRQKIRNVCALGIFSTANAVILAFIIAYFNVAYLQGTSGFGLGLSPELAETIFSYSVAAGSIGFLGTVIIGGAFSDDYRSKYGARAPFILLGSILAGVMLVLTPVFAGLANQELLLLVFPVCFFLIYVGLGLATSPTGALLSELFTKDQREWIGLVLAGFATLGSLIGLILFPTIVNVLTSLVETIQLPPTLSGIGYFLFPALIIILAGLCIFFLIEKANPPFPPIDSPVSDILQTPQYLALGGSDFGKMFFVQSFWGFASETVSIYLLIHLTTESGISKAEAPIALLVVGLVSAIMAIPAGLFISKFGKVKTAIVGSALYSLFCFILAGMEIGNYYSLVFVIAAIGGFGAVFIESVRVSLPADLVPEGKEAQFMGINYFGAFWTQPIVALLGGFVLATFASWEYSPTFILFILAGAASFVATIVLFLISYENMVRSEYYRFYKRYLAIRGFFDEKLDALVDAIL